LTVGQSGRMHEYEVLTSETPFTGRVIAVRQDLVAMPGATTSYRDVVVHPGAVAVLAVRGDEVLLVTQYRHPVGERLEELPAGLLDIDGEPALLAAQRELVEEAGYAAARWDVLVDVWTSPGMTDEAIRVFLARDLHAVERDVQEHEELEMTSRWLALDDAVTDALEGRLTNGIAVTGVLAAGAARARGWNGLRPADAPWPGRPLH
jgi:8-oxo-dGTP pyrophosphatase MutT (NUDIX family)